MLLSGLSGLGLGDGLVRFLPDERFPSRLLNTVLTFNAATALLFACGYLLSLEIWSPSLAVLRQNTFYAVGFLAYTIAMALVPMIQMAYVAHRQAGCALIQTCVVHGGRLLLVSVTSSLGTMGLVGSGALSVVLAVALSLSALLPRVGTEYRFKFSLHRADLARILPYSLSTYIAALLSQNAHVVLPLLTLEVLGAAASGYAYIAWMLGVLLSSPGLALANSAFAEGSHAPERMPAILSRAAGLGLAVTIPAAIGLGVLAPWLLRTLFGSTYAQEGAGLLRWLAMAAPLAVLSKLYFTHLRVYKRMGLLILLSAIVVVITLGVAALWMPRYGIAASGFGWLIGNSVVVIAALGSVLGQFGKARERGLPIKAEREI
jgi:O-antigen/teichoic acid export membrane protein